MHIMCLSETYLDCTVPYDDDPRLNLSGYKLVRAANLSNNKSVGVGIYFKKTLAIQLKSTNSLKECLLLEVLLEIKRDLYYHYSDHQVIHKRIFVIFCFR